MIRLPVLVLMVLLAASLSARAELAKVMSGEHADFTRLVVDLPTEAAWTLGRTPMGYAFAVQSHRQPGYDLSRVWQRIPKTRLQSIRVDPDGGALLLALACACHVVPFEYRPGMIVLDVRDGPAPPGSAFEAGFELLPSAKGFAASPSGAPLEYDWLDVARSQGSKVAKARLAVPSDPVPIALDPLRDELLEQISKGAVLGVVDMELPGKPTMVDAVDRGELPWARISIGDVPGIVIRDGDVPPKGLNARGEVCIPDILLAVREWGAGRSSLDLLVEARSGLFGEFDTLDREAVMRAVRLHLYLGFGAEAAQYGSFLDPGAEKAEIAILQSMARLIEGWQDPSTPFAGMLACDGAAALWAALAHDRLPTGAGVDTDAIVRSFMALPSHLRHSLGASLAEKLLERGDLAAARVIRDAMERSPEKDPAEITLLDAKADLQADRPDAALANAASAVSTGVSGANGLITLVEAHFRKAEPLAFEVAETLQAFRGETGDRAALSRLDRAIALAFALSGRTGAALAVHLSGRDLSDLWHILSLRSTDDDFLRHAVLDDDSVPQVSDDTALEVASRLLDLGFPDSAMAWIGPVSPADATEERRLAARVEAARGDARLVLALLEGLDDAQDEVLRADAFLQLGAPEDAMRAYIAAGLSEEAERLRLQTGDWPVLAGEGETATATEPADLAPIPGAGLLSRGAAILDESADARQAIVALLAQVEAPDP